MSLDDFVRLARRQRAHRRFDQREVPDELVEDVLRAACAAPSVGNLQPWEFVVVRDAELRAEVGRIVAERWHAGGRAWAEAALAPPVTADVDEGATGGMLTAPVLVVVCGDTDRCPADALGSSVYPAVQNLLLAATAAGLGSALTTLAAGGELARLLGLPASVRTMAVIPLGWPARALGPGRRDPLEDHLHRDRW